MNMYFERELAVNQKYDLLVAGGGIAGCAAAICASRLGLKVILIEATGCLGGMATSGLVCAFNPMADGEQMITQGFIRELVETMYKEGYLKQGINPDKWRKDHGQWVEFQPEGLKRVLDEMTIEAKVDVLFFTRLADAVSDKEEGIVKRVIISNVEGLSYIEAKAYIDSTGDAVLSDYCGAKLNKAGKDTGYDKIMPSTLTALFSGIDWTKPSLKSQTPECVKLIENDFKEGLFSQCDRHFVGVSKITDNIGYMNGGHVFNLDSTDINSLSNGIVKGREIVREYERFLRKNSPDCANIELVATGALMGIRESRYIVGEETLTGEDLISLKQFPDQIGVFHNFIDIHPYNCSIEEYDRFLKEKDAFFPCTKGKYYGIPYGALVPKGWKNLWAAGRCISSDVKAGGAVRVMPACAMIGQAAGTAAALALKTNSSAQDIDKVALIDKLREHGAFLPQKFT